MQHPPGKPVAEFDPHRRALWDADIRKSHRAAIASRRSSRKAVRNREAKTVAESRIEAVRLHRRIYALAEDGLRRMDFKSIGAAAKRFHVHENAVRSAILAGNRCAGRRFWWTSRPLPANHFNCRKRHNSRHELLVVGDREYTGLRQFACAVGVHYQSARRYLLRGYFVGANGARIETKFVPRNQYQPRSERAA